ncbi:ornithine cyclodeaminase family protein [Ramlibacter henchirensis]|uniref:Ornithine cyclodeaminase family protein n=1 Tax=Ramlibacter henchirensis TaxID=204072 RepID=A0A4Z0BWB3_9BURK|nr:ornithine cyclodeaminase family protein [Ramlibacter henchirensis]TFZ02774.1 ornithine cyclodeaminase family protein [Ramlibacter henchirensis]
MSSSHLNPPTTSAADAPRFVSCETAAAVFQWLPAIRALQETYARTQGPLAVPRRTIAAGQAERASLRTMTAVPPGSRYYGAKLMGMAFGPAGRQLEYVVVLFDATTGSLAAILDGNLVTAYRTAATSAAALDRMAPPGAARLAVLGSGLEARMHTLAIASVRELNEITVYSPTPAKRAAFAQEMRTQLGVNVRAVDSPAEAVGGADIALAAARSYGEKPILQGAWLKAHATVVSIGSTLPDQREVDSSVVARAGLIVCDNVEEVLEESGDMLAARQDGVDPGAKCFSLNDLMSGKVGRAGGLAMYKSVGSGLQDVVVAGMILDLARSAGSAEPLPIWFEPKRIG